MDDSAIMAESSFMDGHSFMDGSAIMDELAIINDHAIMDDPMIIEDPAIIDNPAFMDEPSFIAQEMEARYKYEKGKSNEAEEHNYTTTKETFVREVATYFKGKPDVIYGIKIASNQHRDPFALVDEKSSASNRGRARAESSIPDTSVATASDARCTAENTFREALTQTPPVDNDGQISYPPSAYCCIVSIMNPNNIDMNAIGILYEFRNYFFVVVPTPPANNQEVPMPRYGFMPEWAVGRYLKVEWEMLKKYKVVLGTVGIGACGADAGKKEWNVHSAKIQLKRAACLEMAKELAVWLAEKEERDLSPAKDNVVRRSLERALFQKMCRLDAEWVWKEQNMLVDAENFMQDFMVYEE
ncbi:hypothetical protein TUN199_10211 [Pyrenophora tritici-repentis]|nr:hypothetical protein Alg130_01687 [Pyrenophora tritici-repentis]KAI0614094.1 hypothetical protein TUN205_01699 [Pyrenophora tritici-repentis]KAI0617795.1 hypothetical protein TUN199_10211 [Pyrenophora tritici-repentis]